MTIASYRYCPEVFGSVITRVQSLYDLTDQEKPYYEFGTYAELLQELKKKDISKEDKFPFVWLIWGEGENVERWEIGGKYSAPLHFFICQKTEKDYNSEDRMANVFKTVLYPLLDLILSAMQDSGSYDMLQLQQYDKTDHYLLSGSGNTNLLGSFVDAIEIKFNQLTHLINC